MQTTAERPKLDASLDGTLGQLEAELVSSGLYAKEAKAMVATWRDQWFEDGLRVFYVLPRADTDAALPLKIDPAPDALTRVLVVRVEVLTPEQVQSVRRDLDQVKGWPEEDRAQAELQLLARRGRFAEPLMRRVLEGTGEGSDRQHLAALAQRMARP